MTDLPDPVVESIRAVRDEAQKLEVACIRIAKTSTLLHIAFDSGLADEFDVSLTHRLRVVQ